uniref:Uncharacterized protein n=1 Tax=Rhizophora mucronata TaxID=61149 RepID=A0A2P2PY10_RHIMU
MIPVCLLLCVQLGKYALRGEGILFSQYFLPLMMVDGAQVFLNPCVSLLNL